MNRDGNGRSDELGARVEQHRDAGALGDMLVYGDGSGGKVTRQRGLAWLLRALSPFLFLVCILHSDVLSQELSFEGNITYEVLGGTGQVVVVQEDLFVAGVKGSLWSITKFPRRFVKFGREQPIANYALAASDGTNFYQISPPSAQKTNGTVISRIGPGVVPFGLSDPKLIVLWYALCSSAYMSTNEDGFLYPPTVLKQEKEYAQDFRVSAEWTLIGHPPYLPRKITFRKFCKSAMDHQSAASPVSNYTHCIYSVDVVATNGGYAVPKLITVRYFTQHPARQALETSATMQIRLTRFEVGSGLLDFRPSLPAGSLVSDLRTISPDTPSGLALANQKEWPRAELTQAQMRQVMRARNLDTRRQEHRILSARLLLIVVACAPLLWLLRKYVARTRSKLRR